MEKTTTIIPAEELNRQTRTIAFCGEENNCFVYFTALILSAAKKRVLIIDNSRDNSLFYAVSGGEDPEDLIRQGITYIKNRKYYHTPISIYDYILIWQGMEIREEELQHSNMIILLPSYEPGTLKALKKVSKFEKKIAAVFMVNATNHNKVNDVKISEQLKVPVEKILSAIPYDMRDYESYLSFLYNGYQNVRGISSDYSICIKEVARLILGVDKRDVKAIIRKSSKIKKEKTWS